jgi:hypothetical protein
MRRISLGLPDDLLDLIEQKRGEVPRERYLRGLITWAMLDPGTPPNAAATRRATGAIVPTAPGQDHPFVGMGKRCNRCNGIHP